MKIIMAADVSIANVIGGGERVLYEQSARLNKRGHTVKTITRKLDWHDSDSQDIGGVVEYRYLVETCNAWRFLMTTCRNARLLFEKIASQDSFQVINFHQPFTGYGIMTSPVSRNIRKVYTCHSLSYEEFVSRNIRPSSIIPRFIYNLNVMVRKYIERRCFQKSDVIVVLSRFTKARLIENYRLDPGKVHVIPGGVDLDRFTPVKNKTPIRDHFGIPKGKIVLLTIRNLVPRMGLHNLIRAMEKVRLQAPELFLVIGGKGPLGENLKRQVVLSGLNEQVTFTGFIAESDLPQAYQMADLFILPTVELEGFGLVTLEALSSGIPVLGTPVGGTREILEKFNASFLFKDTSPEAIADLLLTMHKRILNQSNYLKNLSCQCRQFAEQHYGWEKNIDALETILLG